MLAMLLAAGELLVEEEWLDHSSLQQPNRNVF
jgi:hypothetical protein